MADDKNKTTEIELPKINNSAKNTTDDDLKDAFALTPRDEEMPEPKVRTVDRAQRVLLSFATDLNIGGVDIEEWSNTSSGLAVFIICFNAAIFFGAFIFFTITMTESGQIPKFLSLEPNNTNQLCYSVPLEITAQFEGDMLGNWETSPDFQQNNSVFNIRFDGSAITTEQYQNVMLSFNSKLQSLSEKAARRDSGWNSVLWGTFMFEDADARVTFFSTADPAMIYNAPNPAMLATSVVTSASMGVCNVSRSGFWGEAKDGKLQFFAPVAADMRAKYESNFTSLTPTLVNDLFEPCPNQFKFSTYFNFPSTNAYNYPAFPVFYRNPVLSVGWDVRSIAKALGLNMGIIDFDGLSPISSPYGTKLGQIVSGTFWIDDNYAPMDPIFCANLTSLKYDLNLNVSDTQLDGPPVCVLTGGSFYSPFVYIPMIVSVRSDWDHCTCPGDAKKIGCNNQDYLISMFYDQDVENPKTIFELALKLQNFLAEDPVDGDLAMQEYLHPVISTSALIWYDGPKANDKIDVGSKKNGLSKVRFLQKYQGKKYSIAEIHKQEWAAICPSGTCGAFVFEVFRFFGFDSFMPFNKYYYEISQPPQLNQTYTNNHVTPSVVLKQSMCVNTIYFDSIISQLSEEPPVQLVESYFSCTKTAIAALTDSVGNAAGLAGMVTQGIMLIFGFLLVKCYNMTKGKKDQKALLSAAQKAELDDMIARNKEETVYKLFSEMSVEMASMKARLEKCESHTGNSRNNHEHSAARKKAAISKKPGSEQEVTEEDFNSGAFSFFGPSTVVNSRFPYFGGDCMASSSDSEGDHGMPLPQKKDAKAGASGSVPMRRARPGKKDQGPVPAPVAPVLPSTDEKSVSSLGKIDSRLRRLQTLMNIDVAHAAAVARATSMANKMRTTVEGFSPMKRSSSVPLSPAERERSSAYDHDGIELRQHNYSAEGGSGGNPLAEDV